MGVKGRKGGGEGKAGRSILSIFGKRKLSIIYKEKVLKD